MQTELTSKVDELIGLIRSEIGEHQFHKNKQYPVLPLDSYVYFTIHQSTTENRELKRHGVFHAAPAKKDKNGNPLGRNWPGTAYTLGASEKYGIVQAWPFGTMTYHVGYKGNPKSIGGLVEGNFDKRKPTEHEYMMALAMKVFADRFLGRRLLLKYHDEWKQGWQCPGRFWDKVEFAAMENQYYTELNKPEPKPEPDAPKEETAPKPDPASAKEDTKDTDSNAGSDNPGCLGSLFKAFFKN